MSDDFISGLRADLVDAAARHGRRGAVGRAALPLHPRAWRPAAAVGAVALAATLAAAVIALSTLAPPVQRAGRLDVVAVVNLGGRPHDAAYGGGYLWVADYGGGVLRVDPANRRVLGRVRTPGSAAAITADERAVWVVGPGTTAAYLLRLDPRTGRAVFSRNNTSLFDQIAAGGGGVWTRLYADHHELGRVGPGGAVTGGVRVPNGAGIAVGRDTVWALGNNGSLTEVDAISGDVMSTVRKAISPNNNLSDNAIAPDAEGAWVGDTGAGAVVQVVAGHVARRIPVAPYTGAIARSDDAVWVGTSDASRRRYGLARIDPERGAVTATIDLGHRVPRAIVPVGDSVWVIADDGTATIVRDD